MSQPLLVTTRRIGRGSGPTRAWIAVVALAVVPASLVPGRASAAERQIARINGEPVWESELVRMVGNPLTLGEARQELGVESPGPRDLQRIAMRRVVHRRLLIQEARRRQIHVTDQELDREIASLRRRFDDLRSLGSWMQEQGLDDASLFQTVREDMAADRVRAALIDGVRVSDEDVRQYHGAHAEELGPGEVRLQIIAVRDEGAAKEVVAALRRGEDFGRLARQRSSGMRAAQGGDTGWVRVDALASPLREAVAVLEPGESRGPLRRGSDLLIVRLAGRRTRTLAEVRPEIERRLLAVRQASALEAWLTEQETRSSIELFHDENAGGPRLDGEAAASARARRR